jgi:hypothetical protein
LPVIVVNFLFLVFFTVIAVRAFLMRGLPRVGGKIGPRQATEPPAPLPDGFSRVYARTVTIFTSSADAARFANLKAFLRQGTQRRTILMRFYRVAGCKTEIEIPAAAPDYERLDAAETLGLLRELPDPRLIHRLQLSDEPSFLDPWVRRVAGQQFYLLGNATTSRLVVIYKPDRRQRESVGQTLLHEWLHLVAFAAAGNVRRFKRADAIERLAPLEIEPVSFGDRKTRLYEAWCDLGEKLFGYDETVARNAALEAPMHAMIVWRRVEKILRKAPRRLRSTRFAELVMRGAFMRAEIAPKAREAKARHRFWRRWRLPKSFF